MNGDFSRDTFDARRHYRSVRLQQGRVLTDADWNEQADLTRYHEERLARDVVGACGAPQDAAGFALGAATYPLAVAGLGVDAWVVGEDGVVLRTQDDGASWTPRDSGTTAHLRAVHFADATHGWAVGDGGTIARTTDGGATWTGQDAGVFAALLGVAAADSLRAWAVGEGGLVLRTADGGATWVDDTVGAGRLYAVHVASANAGWIVGQAGQIFATNDGGATWTARASGTSATLRAMTFVSASAGWAVGDGGTIVHTTNGGATWAPQTAPVTTTLRAVTFASASEGWAAGDGGIVLHTVDAGATWTVEPVGTAVALRGGAAGAWLVGDDSTLVRLGAGSPVDPVEALPAVSLAIGAGRLYVDGVLCEVEERASYYNQPNRQAPQRLAPGTHLLYIDVWQRFMSHQMDARIREVALGGPDSAGRAQTVWQLRSLELPPASPADWTCLSDIPGWSALTATARGRLQARAEPEQITTDLCEMPAAAGYRRVENQFYRVEIQDGGVAPTFKWSRENGSVSYAITGASDDTIQNRAIVTLASRGPDETLDLAPGDWVEVVDDEAALERGVGVLRQVLAEGDDRLEIVLDGVLGSAVAVDPSRHPLLRRWDHRPPGTSPALPIQIGQWIGLEDGVQVLFEKDGEFRAGDYWQIPARTLTGDVEWPRDEHGAPASRPPAGVEHHYCRLGLVEITGDGSVLSVSDCRHLFPPLTALTLLLYASGDGQDGLPGVELPQPLSVRVMRGEQPVAGATVRFAIESGGGTLVGAAPGTPLDVSTLADGGAAARVVLDADPARSKRYQRVRAALLDAAGSEAPGQSVVFCATATVLLASIAGDGQEGTGGQDLPHRLEVRVSNGQRPAPNQKVRFAVAEGGGAIVGANPVTTDTEGVAHAVWRLGGSGLQRVEAELLDAADTRVQHVAFNAGFAAGAAGGGCTVSIGPTGDFKQLTGAVLNSLLEKFKGQLCLCFQPGTHRIEGLQGDGGDVSRISIAGCGAAATLDVRDRVTLKGFQHVELARVGVTASPRAGFDFGSCREVVIRGLEAEAADALGEPLFRFSEVAALTVDGCTMRVKLPGMAIVVDDAAGPQHVTDNEISGLVSFYGRPNGTPQPDVAGLLNRLRQPGIVIEPGRGQLFVSGNAFEVLTIGEKKFDELTQFIAGATPRLSALFAAAALTGNTFTETRSLFLSAMVTLASTSFAGRVQPDQRLGVFVAQTATVVGTVWPGPVNDGPPLTVATPLRRCLAAANVPRIELQ